MFFMIIRNPPHIGEDFKKGYENDYYHLYFNLSAYFIYVFYLTAFAYYMHLC